MPLQETNPAALSFREARASAFVPFAALCVMVIASYTSMKVDIMNRPELKKITAKAQASPMQGKKAPAFTLEKLDGGQASLSDYRGKVLFINVWATWCLPCREEMPSMEKLYRKMKGDDFEMLAISIDEGGKKVVESFRDEFGLTFPILLDPKSEVAARYKTTGVPETFLVDKNGVIVHHVLGPRDWGREVVTEVIEKLIGRPAATGYTKPTS